MTGLILLEKFITKIESLFVKIIANHLVNGLYTLTHRYTTLIPPLSELGVALLLLLVIHGTANGVLTDNSLVP